MLVIPYQTKIGQSISQVGKYVAEIGYAQKLPITIDTLRLGLPRPICIEIPIFRLFNFETLGLYNVLLSTGGKICAEVDGIHSPKSAIDFPA